MFKYMILYFLTLESITYFEFSLPKEGPPKVE